MSAPKGWGGAASLPDFFGGSAGTGGGALEGELGGLEEADVANDHTFDAPLQQSQPLPDFFGGGGQKAALEEDDWARQQAEFERLRKLQAARLQGGGGGGGPVVLSLSALEGSIEALPVLRSGSAGSNGDDDALLNMDLQHEVDRLTLDEDDEHVITTAVAQAKASRDGPRVLSLQEVEAMEAKQQQQAQQQQQALPPPAVSNSGANANAAGLVMRPVPHGLLMSSRDVLYVIQQQLRQMAYSGTNGDAFSDDYYYTQARLREQDKQQDKAQPSGGGSVLAVPVWKETREMARQAQATQVLEARARTTAWEEGNRVLGHTSKSAISRPREILSIARGEEDKEEDKGDDVLSGGPVLLAGSKPFTSHTWKTRKHVDEVQCVLLSIEECVLSLRNAYVLPDKAAQLQDQLTLHKQALSLLLLPSSPLTPSLLDLPKGLKAIAQALPQLPPPSAHALLPLLTSSLVTRAPPPPSSDWGVAEAPLLSSLLSLLRTPPLPSISLLCSSLEGVVKAYMAGPIPLPQQHQATLSLRQALATRNRAEVLHTLLQVGKSQSEACHSYSDANHWKALQDKLIQMLQQP